MKACRKCFLVMKVIVCVHASASWWATVWICLFPASSAHLQRRQFEFHDQHSLTTKTVGESTIKSARAYKNYHRVPCPWIIDVNSKVSYELLLAKGTRSTSTTLVYKIGVGRLPLRSMRRKKVWFWLRSDLNTKGDPDVHAQSEVKHAISGLRPSEQRESRGNNC